MWTVNQDATFHCTRNWSNHWRSDCWNNFSLCSQYFNMLKPLLHRIVMIEIGHAVICTPKDNVGLWINNPSTTVTNQSPTLKKDWNLNRPVLLSFKFFSQNRNYSVIMKDNTIKGEIKLTQLSSFLNMKCCSKEKGRWGSLFFACFIDQQIQLMLLKYESFQFAAPTDWS